METATSPQVVSGVEPAPVNVESFATIAQDRLEGAEAFRQFIDPNMTLREIRRRLEAGHYPCWKEGRLYVGSKSALLKNWREKAQKAAAQPPPGTRQPTNRSTRRGYLGR